MREPHDFSSAVTFIRHVAELQNDALSPDPTRNDSTVVAKGGMPAETDEAFVFLQAMLGVGSTGAGPSGFAGMDQGASSCMVLEGSPLFEPGIDTDESTLRRLIIERDWLDGIVFLPTQLFDTGGVGAQLWVLVMQKERLRRGSVVLVDARSAGSTNNSEAPHDTIVEITHLVRDALDLAGDTRVQVQPNEAFGHFYLTIDRPLRLIWRLDEDALDALAATDEWQAYLTRHSSANPTNPLDFFYELVAERRHHLGITWDTAKACSKDLRGPMGGHLHADVARMLVAAVETTSELGVPQPSSTRAGFKSDPELRVHAQVALPFGYLGMSPLGQREAKSRAAKAYMTIATSVHADAWVDGSKTLVGYTIPAGPA